MKRSELDKIFHVIDFYFASLNDTRKEMLMQRIKEHDVDIEEEDNLKIVRHISKGFADYLRKEKLGHQANRLEEIIERYEDHIKQLNKEILGLHAITLGGYGGETLNNIEAQVHIDEAEMYKDRALNYQLCGNDIQAIMVWQSVYGALVKAVKVLKR